MSKVKTQVEAPAKKKPRAKPARSTIKNIKPSLVAARNRLKKFEIIRKACKYGTPAWNHINTLYWEQYKIVQIIDSGKVSDTQSEDY